MMRHVPCTAASCLAVHAIAGNGAGNGELSAALSGLRMIIGVLTPPMVGWLYKFFTQPSRPLGGAGPSGVYYLGTLLFLGSFAILRTVRDREPSPPPSASSASGERKKVEQRN